MTSNPGYRGAEFPDGVDDTPAVRTHHGGLPDPVGLDRTAVWGRQGAGSLVRGAARGGESKEREARLLGAGGTGQCQGSPRSDGSQRALEAWSAPDRRMIRLCRWAPEPEAGSLWRLVDAGARAPLASSLPSSVAMEATYQHTAYQTTSGYTATASGAYQYQQVRLLSSHLSVGWAASVPACGATHRRRRRHRPRPMRSPRSMTRR
eukprot:COSAG01_NODE_491_length_16354_cov_26.550784_7_plen_206_part_00